MIETIERAPKETEIRYNWETNANFEVAPKSTEKFLTWHDAKLYCFTLLVNGNAGWRLPNKIELSIMCQFRTKDYEEYYYWATEEDSETAWNQMFNNGGYLGVQSKKRYKAYTRAIRDLT